MPRIESLAGQPLPEPGGGYLRAVKSKCRGYWPQPRAQTRGRTLVLFNALDNPHVAISAAVQGLERGAVLG
jgi:hypothetical protein